MVLMIKTVIIIRRETTLTLIILIKRINTDNFLWISHQSQDGHLTHSYGLGRTAPLTCPILALWSPPSRKTWLCCFLCGRASLSLFRGKEMAFFMPLSMTSPTGSRSNATFYTVYIMFFTYLALTLYLSLRLNRLLCFYFRVVSPSFFPFSHTDSFLQFFVLSCFFLCTHFVNLLLFIYFVYF